MWKYISALAVIILLINPHYHVVRRKKPNMNIYLKLIKLKKNHTTNDHRTKHSKNSSISYESINYLG